MSGQTIAELERQLEEARGELAHYRKLSEESGNRRLRETGELSNLIADLRRTRGELQKTRDELESRVQERTAALMDTNRRLVQEMVERRKIEEELRKSESRYRYIFEAAAVSIWEEDFSEVKVAIDNLKGRGVRDFRRYFDDHPEFVRQMVQKVRILDVNQRSLKMYEAPDRDTLLASHEDVLLPEGMGAFSEGLVAIAEGRRYLEVETCDRTLQGKRLNILLTASFPGPESPFDNVLVSIVDITERKQAEEALKESEARYRMLYELESDSIFVIENETGRLLAANTAAAKMYGYTREELLAIKNTDLSAEPEETRHVTSKSVIDQEIVAFVPLRYHRKKDGAVFPVEITGRFFTWQGRGVHIAAIRDITERKRAEEERIELERRLFHAQKLESLGVLAGGIAHDFNNLLMAILGNLDLILLDLSATSPVRYRIEQAMQAAQRAADLTRQILAYSGKGCFMVTRLDLSKLVRENADLFRTAIPRTITWNLCPTPEYSTIEADPGQIQQVIMNLITNAAEAIGDRAGLITVTTGLQQCEEVYLSRSLIDEKPSAGQFVYVEVSDTGCGMDYETLQRLFDPFFTTKFVGRGLGMSAVLGIVRGHKGAILVESTVGQETTIRLLFPACEAGGVATTGVFEESPRESEVLTHSGIVMVVDDEKEVCTVCAALVECLGFRTITAADGEEALLLFKKHADELTCVLLDLTMPRLDGAATFREMKEIRPDIPVILCSGYSEQDAARRFTGEGLSGFIQKPYRLQELKDAIGSIKGGRQCH